jgi:type IV pilus assembly protein PilW
MSISKVYRGQQGFSLIEMMVALAINLVIVVAAAYLYIGTADSRRALDQQQTLNENGQYALDLIGRDIINAGFYPTVRGSNPSATTATLKLVPDTYSNIVAGSPAAYNSGVFGCTAQNFNPAVATNACANHADASNTADALVINYFTNDAMGDDIGQRLDCARGNVDGATENATRVNAATAATAGATSALIPKAPLFVSNRYTLLPVAMSIEGQTINTYGVACSGNSSVTYQPAVSGIEQLQFRYGVYIDDTTLQPTRYYRADEMGPLGSLLVDGVSKDAWARVVSIEVCLVARGLQASKVTTSTGGVTSYTDCGGTVVAPTDKFVRRVYRKVFALRNNLTQTIIPAP